MSEEIVRFEFPEAAPEWAMESRSWEERNQHDDHRLRVTLLALTPEEFRALFDEMFEAVGWSAK